MKDSKLFLLTSLLVLAAAVSAGVTRWTDRDRPAIARPGQVSVPEAPPAQELVADGTCVSATFYGFPSIEVGDNVEILRFPPAKRLSYDEGAPQYVAQASADEIEGFYDSVMRAGCWKVADRRPNQVLYTKDDKMVRLSLYPNPISGRTVIAYAEGAGSVLGETVYAAQTPTCTGDQVLCTMNGGSWCQVPPCPTSTPSSPSGSTCSGSYQQPNISSPACNTGICPSGCTYGSDGCPNGCYTSAPTPPSSTPACSGTYQQSGSTYPSCNYSTCPNGCTWDSQGCPNGCYTSPSSGSCPSGQNWCASSNSCIPSGSSCGGSYTSCPSDQYMCNGVCVPMSSSCSASGSACPSGQYWCGSTNSCKPTSDTNCSPGGGGSGCPSGQYWCNGACIATGSYCAPYGGTGYPDKASCEGSGGRWCQPTTSPHCHGPGDPAPCEADVPGGGYGSTCPSGQYWCNGACVSTSTSCSSYTSCPSGQYWCGSMNTCKAVSDTYCPPSGGGTTCPSGQYMCNGACIVATASCSSTSWPADQASCSSSGKYWCLSSSGSSYGWCQSTACGSTGTSSACGSGTYFCPSANSCVPSGSSCGSYQPPSCPSGQYWCSSVNSCVNNSVQCAPPPPNPTPIPVKCGQCQVAQNGTCVRAPVGTLDPLCNGGQCDMYGGCVNLSGSRKLVGQGAICGDYWCNMEKGENKENCPSDGCTNTPPVQPQQVPPSPYQQNQQPQYPGQQYPQPQQGQHEGNYPGGSGYQGMSEEEAKKWEEQQKKQQCEMMKRGMTQFAREMQRMQKMLDRIKKGLAQAGVGMPQELVNALAKAPELIEKIKNSTNCDEIEGITDDMQDIAMTMQDLGPRLGELEGLGRMLKEADRQVKNMFRDFKRVQSAARRNAALVDEVKELEATVGLMSKAVADAKTLAKTDPFSARDVLEDNFWGATEEFYERMRLIDMLSNVGRAVSQANTEIQRADRRITTLSRRKDVPKEVIADLKDMLAEIKAMVPQLKELLAKKPVDFDEVGIMAESFWGRISEFEAEMEKWGASAYVPQFQDGQGIKLDIPQGFIMPQTSGGDFGGGGFGAPLGDFGSPSGSGGGGGFPAQP